MTNQVASQITCFCCGVCCAKYQAQITLAEADRICENLALTRREFIDKYTDPRWPGVDNFLARHVNGACVFLDWHADRKYGLCRIHGFKPRLCSDWEANTSKFECRLGLEKNWNLKLADDGSTVGSSGNKHLFQVFINSITQKEN